MSTESTRSPHPGILIVFEGNEGAGKSTIAKRLVEHLNADTSHGYNEAEYASEWLTQFGKVAKNAFLHPEDSTDKMASMSEVLTILAAKNEFIVKVVRPAVAAGKILICDRYTATLLAYQGGMRGMGMDTIIDLMRLSGTDVLPNVELFFDVSNENRRLRRAAHRDHMEATVDALGDQMTAFFDEAVAKLRRISSYQRVKIDANNTPDQVFADVLTVVRQRLKFHRVSGASINNIPKAPLFSSVGLPGGTERFSGEQLFNEIFSSGTRLPPELLQQLSDGSVQLTLPPELQHTGSVSTPS